jgi:secondary thiamine-phosphate synthase enzyme
LEIQTSSRTELIDITRRVEEAVRKTGVKEGICYIFVPHTTAGVTINENADPDVVEDILTKMNEMIPFESSYLHGEGNSDAHIKAGLIGPSQTVFIDSGRLFLGTWQGIFFCEFDGPRSRKVNIKVVKAETS